MNAPQDDTNFGIGTLVTRVCAAAALALVALSQSAHAQYPEKNIDLIVPYGPGGGFDLYARAVGRAMENHLPKTIRVIVRNVPGAGSVNGIASMYRAAPDGYTMGIVDLPGAVAPQIMGEQLPYELDKATWLGTVNIGVYSLVIGKKPTFWTLEAFQKPTGRAPFFATTGSNDLAMARIAAAVLGIKAQFLTSYTGDRRRDRAPSCERRPPAARVVRQERHARNAAGRLHRGRRRPPRACQSQPQSGVRGAAGPPRDGPHAACRRHPEGAEGPRARSLGNQDEFPARRRNAGADAKALYRPAGVPHQLPASAQDGLMKSAVSIGLMVRSDASRTMQVGFTRLAQYRGADLG